MGILDAETSPTSDELDEKYALKPNNGARAVGQGELVVNVRDFGAVGDGVTDDTAAIRAALAVGAANGATVKLGGVNKTYVVSQLVLGYRAALEIPTGITLRRLAGNAETGPVVLINRVHASISGKGTVEALNDCPDGVLRIERTDFPCEWVRIDNVHVKGPGRTNVNTTGVVLSGFATFQNRLNGVVVSDVSVGTRHEGGANMNHLTDVDLYNIGTLVHDFDGTMESSIIGGSVSQAQDSTVFRFRNGALYNRVLGFLAEPGGSSTFWDIASGCIENHFIGVVDNTAHLGRDAGTRTTAILRRRAYLGGELYLEGSRVFPAQLARKAVSESRRNVKGYWLDGALRLPVTAGATYEVEAFIVYSSSPKADAKFALATPPGATAQWTISAASRQLARGNAVAAGTFAYLDQTMGQAVGGAGGGKRLVAQIKGLVTTAQASGQVGIKWAQAVARSSDLTVAAGSWMTLRRVA